MKVHKQTIDGRNFEHWYDRHTRCWWAAEFDAEGNQIGAAEHAYTRDEILSQVDYIKHVNEDEFA